MSRWALNGIQCAHCRTHFVEGDEVRRWEYLRYVPQAEGHPDHIRPGDWAASEGAAILCGRCTANLRKIIWGEQVVMPDTPGRPGDVADKVLHAVLPTVHQWVLTVREAALQRARARLGLEASAEELIEEITQTDPEYQLALKAHQAALVAVGAVMDANAFAQREAVQ